MPAIAALSLGNNLIAVCATGLLAGLLHVFAGPDHLAAVAPLAARQGARAWRLGLRWGLGHAAGALLLGLLALILREVLPLERLSAWSERAVGLVLIGIGLWGLHQAWRLRLHTHRHEHDEGPHEHIHAHAAGSAHPPERVDTPHDHGHAAFGVGLLHGAAGSHHLFGLLPALALPSRLASGLYLLAFALGSIAGMLFFSGLLGRFFAALRGGGERGYRALLGGTGLAAIAVGVFWLAR